MAPNHYEITRHNAFILRNVNANAQLVLWRGLRMLDLSKLNLIDLDYYRKPANFLKFLMLNYLKRKQKTIRKPSVWLMDQWSGNYYHWLVEAIPKLLATQLDLSAVVVVLPAHYRQWGFHAETLKHLGAEVEFFDEVKERLFFQQLFLPLNVSLGGTANPMFIRMIRERFRADAAAKEKGRKIYCSRALATKRRIVNEAEVTDYLKREGFEVVFWEKLSFSEQVQVAAQATILIGLHGAGLTNMMFMSPQSTVLELTRTREDNFCYEYLAHAADLQYHSLECESLSESIHLADCRVDVKLLQSKLAELSPRFGEIDP